MEETAIYNGWNVSLLKNQWLKLSIAPQLGGRIIQLEMNGYEFFFVNRQLAGKEPDSTRLGPNGTWPNFGGEKIWPAPQGWDSPNQWPGPPDPVLDSGVYEVDKDDSENKVLTLLSPFDSYTGLQIERDVVLSEDSSEVIIKARFCNKSNKARKWSIWPVCQIDMPEVNRGKQYQIVCPVNPNSKFEDGYKVMHGVVNTPQIKFDSYGNLVVDYQYLVGKVGLDTNSNWIASIDKTTGKVFVLKFQYQEDKLYPDNTSVHIWSQGRGLIYSRNRIAEFKNDELENPPYMEMELLSPLQDIQPGERMEFEYRMSACTIPAGSEIKSVNELGVIASPLQIITSNDGIAITAKYGVYTDGRIKLMLREASEPGNQFCLLKTQVSPFEGITINQNIKQDLLTGHCTTLTIEMYDKEECFIGELDKITINE